MKIAFDFHGVLEAYPDKFKVILESLMQDNEIIILSGPPYEQIVEELNLSGYFSTRHFDAIISVVDWIKLEGIEMKQHEDKSWYCSDKDWWSSKGNICKQYNIEMLFDDQTEYKEYMDNKTLFIHVK